MSPAARCLFAVPAVLLLGAAPPKVKSAAAATIEEAIPADATMALYLRRIDPGLGRSLELLAQLFGVDATVEFLHEAPLPMLALRTVENGQELGIDPGKGLGLFRSPEFDGLVGVVGVSDGKKAARAVAELLVKRGAKRTASRPGLITLELPDGFAFDIGTARGYLYLFMESGELPLLPSASKGSQDPQRLAAALSKASGPGLGGNPHVARLKGRATGADLFFYVHEPFSADSDLHDAFFAADLRNGEVRLDGFAEILNGTWPAGATAEPRTTGFAAGKPFGHALIGAPFERLIALFAGNAGTMRRVLVGRALEQEGLDLEALVAAIPGDLTVHAYTADGPTPRWTVIADAALAPGKPAEQAMAKLLAVRLPFQRVTTAGGKQLFVTSLLGQPVTASVDDGRLRAIAGHLPDRTAALGRVGAPLVPGHLELMLDLRALGIPLDRRTETDWPGAGADGPDGGLPLPFGRGELDVFPEDGGLRIRGLLLPDPGPRPVQSP